MTFKDMALLALLAVCLGVSAGWALEKREVAEELAELAKLRTERLELEAEAAGWAVRLEEETGDLRAELAQAVERGDAFAAENAELFARAEELQGNVSVLSTMYAELRDRVAADATIEEGEDGAPRSASATIDDGALSAEVRYDFPPVNRFELEWAVRLGLSLGYIETPDGRVMVTARADDPRTELEYGPVYYSPPPPVQFCSWRDKGEVALWTVGITEAVRAIAGAFSSRE